MRCGSRGTFAGHICCTAHHLGVHHALELCIYVEHKGCSMPLEFTFGTCVETTWRTWYQIQMRNHNPINSTWKRKLRHKNFGAHSSQHKYTIHTMASMTQATVTGITAMRHSSPRKKKGVTKGHATCYHRSKWSDWKWRGGRASRTNTKILHPYHQLFKSWKQATAM